MVSDIVKQIVLKFKSEGGPEVARQIQAMTRASGMSPRDVDKTLSNMSKINQTLSKSGVQMSSEFSKVKKIFEELNTKHVDQFSRKIDRVTKLMKSQSDELQRLQATGASASKIQAQAQRMGQSSQLFNRMASNGPNIPNPGSSIPTPGNMMRTFAGEYAAGGGGMGGIGSGLRGIMRMPGGGFALATGAIAAGAAVVGSGARAYEDYLETRQANRSLYAGRLKENRMDYYSGNLTKAALANEGYYQKVNQDTAARMRARDVQKGAGFIGGAAGLIGGGALLAGSIAATGLTFGAASPVTLATGAAGVAAMGAGAYGMYNSTRYALFGGREQEREQIRRDAEQKRLNETMTPELMAQFRSTQRSRFQFASRFGIGTGDMHTLRQRGYQANFNEDESMAAAESLRMFGNGNAMTLAPAAMRAARAQGTSLGSATGQISAMALTAAGGEKKASDNLKEVFNIGVASGIKDSGLLDGFKELVGTIMSNAGYRTDAGRMANVVAQAVGPGAGARELAAVPEAFGGLNQATGGTRLKQQLNFNSAMDIARKSGVSGPGLIGVSQELSQIPFEQLMAGQIPPHLRQALGPNADKMIEDMKKARIDTLTAGKEGRSAMEVLQNPFQHTNQEYGIAKSTLKRLSGVKTEEALNEEVNLVTGVSSPMSTKTAAQISAEGDAQAGRNLAGAQSTAEGKAEAKRFAGQADLDQQVQDAVASKIDSILDTFDDTIKKSVDEGNLSELNSAVDNIVSAANKLAAALGDAAGSISGSGVTSHATPSNND